MEFHRKTIRKPIEKVAIVNYPTVHKSLKQWLRRKKARKVYQYLQLHRPQLSEHNYLCYEIHLKSIIKLIQTQLTKNEAPSIPLLQRFANEGYKLLKELHQQFHCQQSYLKGNTKIRNHMDKHIDLFWMSYLDLFTSVAIGYKLNSQWKWAFDLLQSSDAICNQITNSSTSNKQLLRKTVKTKFIIASFYTEISDYKSSVRYLQASLFISLNELIIRDREQDHLKKDSIKGKKAYRQLQQCKQTIIRVLLKLCYNYDLLQQYDVVPFLMIHIRHLLFEWKIQKSSGIYKLVEKIDSTDCLDWYNDYDMIFEQLNYMLNLMFNIPEIRRIRDNKNYQVKSRKKVVRISHVEEEIQKSQCQQQNTPQDAFSNEPQKYSVSSLKQSKVMISHPSIATISQSKGIQASAQMPCTQQLLDFDTLKIVKNKRKTLSYKKQDKKQFQQRNNIQYTDNSLQQIQQSEVDGYIRVIVQSNKPKNRFLPYHKVQNKMRKLSLNIKKSFNNVEYEMYKIRSRSNQKRPLQKLHKEYQFQNATNIKFPNAQMQIRNKQSRTKTIKLKSQISNNKKSFHDLLFKHKQQLDLNRLYAHHTKMHEKQNTEKVYNVRRSREIMDLQKHVVKKLVNNLYQKSMQGIQQMKQQLKVKDIKQPKQIIQPKKIPKKMRDTNLFLSSIINTADSP